MVYKKTFLFFLLSFISASLFLCFSASFAQDEGYVPNQDVIRLVNQGIELHKKKDYEGAIQLFNEALSIEPNNTVVKQNVSIAHNNYGKYLAERTDYESALKEFRMAIYIDPTNDTAEANLDALLRQQGVKAGDPLARMQLGDKLRADAKFEYALIEYKKALKISKEPDPSILINLGDIYYILYLRDGQRTNDINNAIDSYKKALSIKDSAKANIKVADGLLALKDVVGAIEHYRKAVELEPNSQDALTANIRGWNEAVRLAPLVTENHIGLAQALQLKKDFVHAEEEFTQALKLDPGNEIAEKGLKSLEQDKIKARASQFSDQALKLQAEGKYEDAIQQYVKAIEINFNDATLHYNIGTAFQAKGDFDHAQKAYDKALQIDSSNQKVKSAIDILNKQVAGKKFQDLSARAIELQSSNNYQEAITTYLAAISINPNDAGIYYNLGTAYQAAKDLNNAQQQYKKALELDKGNVAYQNALKLVNIEIAEPIVQSAISKQTANDLAGAIADYSMALELLPEDAQTYFNIGTAYQANKQTDEAIKSYMKSVQLDPKGQADAFFFLAAVYEEMKNNKAAIENYQKYLQNAPTGSYAKDANERIAYLKTLKQ